MNDDDVWTYEVEDGVDPIALAIYEYLDNRHVTLFLNWDISQRDRREDCVKFLKELYVDLEELVMRHTVRNAKPITKEEFKKKFLDAIRTTEGLEK